MGDGRGARVEIDRVRSAEKECRIRGEWGGARVRPGAQCGKGILNAGQATRFENNAGSRNDEGRALYEAAPFLRLAFNLATLC